MGHPPDSGSGKPPGTPPAKPAGPAAPGARPATPAAPARPAAPAGPPVLKPAAPQAPTARPGAPAAKPPALVPPAPATAAPTAPPRVPAVPAGGTRPPQVPAAPAAPRPAAAPGAKPIVPPAPAAKPPAPAAAPASTGLTGVGRVDQMSDEQIIALDAVNEVLDELDYFQVLKLQPDATISQIKAAFYRESRAYHPDRFYHLADTAVKEKVNEVYKRVTEAYYVLRDDARRRQYTADISGPDRKQKLRFTEASETETKQAQRKAQEEQIGTTPKGRQFYTEGMKDFEAGRWQAALRNFKSALMYEPQNARYKEKVAESEQKVHEQSKSSGGSFTIK